MGRAIAKVGGLFKPLWTMLLLIFLLLRWHLEATVLGWDILPGVRHGHYFKLKQAARLGTLIWFPVGRMYNIYGEGKGIEAERVSTMRTAVGRLSHVSSGALAVRWGFSRLYLALSPAEHGLGGKNTHRCSLGKGKQQAVERQCLWAWWVTLQCWWSWLCAAPSFFSFSSLLCAHVPLSLHFLREGSVCPAVCQPLCPMLTFPEVTSVCSYSLSFIYVFLEEEGGFMRACSICGE